MVRGCGESLSGLKEIQGLKSLTIQAAFSTTKPCVSKTEQRPITAERAGVLLQTREPQCLLADTV